MPRETDFTEYDESTINFLNSFNKGTKATYKAYFKLFLTYKNMTGQQILESRKSDKNFEWETNVLKFKQWMKTQKAKNGEFYSDNAVSTAVNAVRSFFDHYKTKLNFNHNEARKLNGKPQRVTKDYVLTNPVLEKMASQGDLRDRYIVLLGKSLGLRASDFITLTYGDFRALDLNKEPPIFISEIITKKEKAKANLFLDADALPIVKQIIDSNKDKKANERIITVHEDELSTIIQRLAKKADIPIGDYHLRFHCFRKYLINWLARSIVSDSIWKQIVGKVISEDAYVGDLLLRDSYLKVMEFTTIYKENGNSKVSKLSEQVSALNKQVSEQITQLSNQIESKDKEIAELKKRSDLIWNEFMPMYSVAASSTDPDKVDEEVESFISLLKETDDDLSKNVVEYANHVFKRDLPSGFKTQPYVRIFDILKKELYRIKDEARDEREKLAAITLKNEASNEKTKS